MVDSRGLRGWNGLWRSDEGEAGAAHATEGCCGLVGVRGGAQRVGEREDQQAVDE